MENFAWVCINKDVMLYVKKLHDDFKRVCVSASSTLLDYAHLKVETTSIRITFYTLNELLEVEIPFMLGCDEGEYILPISKITNEMLSLYKGQLFFKKNDKKDIFVSFYEHSPINGSFDINTISKETYGKIPELNKKFISKILNNPFNNKEYSLFRKTSDTNRYLAVNKKINKAILLSGFSAIFDESLVITTKDEDLDFIILRKFEFLLQKENVSLFSIELNSDDEFAYISYLNPKLSLRVYYRFEKPRVPIKVKIEHILKLYCDCNQKIIIPNDMVKRFLIRKSGNVLMCGKSKTNVSLWNLGLFNDITGVFYTDTVESVMCKNNEKSSIGFGIYLDTIKELIKMNNNKDIEIMWSDKKQFDESTPFTSLPLFIKAKERIAMIAPYSINKNKKERK